MKTPFTTPTIMKTIARVLRFSESLPEKQHSAHWGSIYYETKKQGNIWTTQKKKKTKNATNITHFKVIDAVIWNVTHGILIFETWIYLKVGSHREIKTAMIVSKQPLQQQYFRFIYCDKWISLEVSRTHTEKSIDSFIQWGGFEHRLTSYPPGLEFNIDDRR